MAGKIKKYKITKNTDGRASEARPSDIVGIEKEIDREEAERILNREKAARPTSAKSDPRTRNKKIILIVTAAALAFVALYYGIGAIAHAIAEKKRIENENNKPSKIVFFSPDYNEDITKDAGYMDLDRNFYFEDPSYGTKYAYDTDTLDEVSDSYRACVRALTDFLVSAINGSTSDINACFSDYYVKNGGKLKEAVAPQKLYDIVITYDGESTTGFPDTSETRCFWIEYKIRMNNGTFRDDMGSNCSRKEYACVSVRDGKGEIDLLVTYKTEQ